MEKFNSDNSKKEGLENPNIRNEMRVRKIEARESKPKYYCALSAKYKVGEIIMGKSINSEFKTPSVFLTTSPRPHISLKDRDDVADYTIYRVVPIGSIKPGYQWDELSAQSAEVVEVIGSARRFVERNQYSRVKLGYDPLMSKRVAEFYQDKNIKNPNSEGASLLEKIRQKHITD